MAGKDELRKSQRQRRSQLDEAEIVRLSNSIVSRFMGWLSENPPIRHIHLFLPIKRLREVDTFPLFFQLQRSGYFLYTSQIDGYTGGLLTLDITKVHHFEPDSWGIPSPIGGKLADPARIEVVVVPLLAFDIKGNRLGYGKGFYDGFLSGLDASVLKVGFSLFEASGEIPAEIHDVSLDCCVTPDRIYTF